VKIARSSGILLHITSLPGNFGIGDVGPESRWFVDALAEAKQKLWCILPVGPTGPENSPYQSRSAFAGNPLLISPHELVEEGYLSSKDLRSPPFRSPSLVDFPAVRRYKEALLRKAFLCFSENKQYRGFLNHNFWWLDPFAQFMALKEANRDLPWTRFDSRNKPAADSVRYFKFVQYEFARQWGALRRYCDKRKISLMGDAPFYVEHDSADVWTHPQLFDLRPNGEPRTVGGVPPDYFSKDGQRWGTPTYRWKKLEETKFKWWTDRLRSALTRTEILRLDHFRGFEAFWSVPAEHPTARRGHWVKGPGAKLFDALQKELGPLPFVAENLGVVTPKVEDLRRRFRLPGMAVFQFGFDGDDTHKPCNYRRKMVAFTGTHDNDTVIGWWESIRRGKNSKTRPQLDRITSYLQARDGDLHWSIIQAVLTSVADLAIVPVQDVLGLGSEARMNVPGIAKGNWSWRLRKEQLRPDFLKRLGDLTIVSGR
jgi:4-alpha-glucanotransferase